MYQYDYKTYESKAEMILDLNKYGLNNWRVFSLTKYEIKPEEDEEEEEGEENEEEPIAALINEDESSGEGEGEEGDEEEEEEGPKIYWDVVYERII